MSLAEWLHIAPDVVADDNAFANTLPFRSVYMLAYKWSKTQLLHGMA